MTATASPARRSAWSSAFEAARTRPRVRVAAFRRIASRAAVGDGRAKRRSAVNRREALTPIGPASLPPQWREVARPTITVQISRPAPNGDGKANAATPPKALMLDAGAVTVSVTTSPKPGSARNGAGLLVGRPLSPNARKLAPSLG
jgi:hypothetical protein